MADSIYAPTQDDNAVDPRLLKAALSQNKDSIFGPGYTATATPSSSPATAVDTDNATPSIYGASTAVQGPTKPASAVAAEENETPHYLRDLAPLDPKAGQWDRERYQLNVATAQKLDDEIRHQQELKAQAPLVAAHAKWFSGEGRQTGGAATFAAEDAKARELFADDPEGYADWFKRKTERSQPSTKSQTFVSHTPDGDVLFEKDPTSGEWRQAKTGGGGALVKPPTPTTFAPTPTDQGIVNIPTRGPGATAGPQTAAPGGAPLNRVSPEPSSEARPLSALDVQRTHEAIQNEIDKKYPIIDAQGNRTDNVAALRLQNQREREAGIAPGMRQPQGAQAPSPAGGPAPAPPQAPPMNRDQLVMRGVAQYMKKYNLTHEGDVSPEAMQVITRNAERQAASSGGR